MSVAPLVTLDPILDAVIKLAGSNAVMLERIVRRDKEIIALKARLAEMDNTMVGMRNRLGYKDEVDR